MAWKYFSLIRRVRHDPTKKVRTFCDLDVQKLKAHGVKALILDFDGVLSTFGEVAPEAKVMEKLKKAIDIFGIERVVILSNKPFLERQQYIEHQFPGLEMPCYRKKPYPDGLVAIADKLNLEMRSLLIVDDRLLTGILAGIMVGAQVKWVTKPYISLSKKPMVELGFMVLRFFEKIVFS